MDCSLFLSGAAGALLSCRTLQNTRRVGAGRLIFAVSAFDLRRPSWFLRGGCRWGSALGSSSSSSSGYGWVGGDDSEFPAFEELRIPGHWLEPSRASEESEWLRVTLHKWLDDEYCPEDANIEISKVAAHSYHKSLMEKQTDLGEILLKMGKELESISYQDSFHGAYSSANAAVDLIAQRMEQESSLTNTNGSTTTD